MDSSGKKPKRKIGRNEPCPCGSGKKYKKCHGAFPELVVVDTSRKDELPDSLKQKIAEMEALRKQRNQQQGLGRGIISTDFKGHKFVAVGNRVYWSDKWKTFHDFLFDYIKNVLGSDWGKGELTRPLDARHAIMQWYDIVCRHQRASIKEPGKVHTAVMIGAVAAYINLAYNLYLLSHNAKIQSRLIERLKDPQHFHGAYYETFVAAAFIKAGFELVFENEADGSTSHCEFTATCSKTGNKYSVEAKSREPNKASLKIGNQLYDALKKRADFTRIVFIDINIPDDVSEPRGHDWFDEPLANLKAKEISMTIDGEPAPPAYVFLTNHPYHFSLETADFRWAILAEGFKIADFTGAGLSTIREALRARRKHADIIKLLSSIQEHYDIPSTFDGEFPEFAFQGEGTPRLLIGHKYVIPDANGNEVVGELVEADVSESQKIAYGIYKLADGQSVISTCPLTDAELSAYRRHPDTFFGVYAPTKKRAETPLELFDFFFDSFRNTPKERLLELLADHPEFERLKEESQEELALTYCEGVVYSILNSKDNPFNR